MASGSENSTRKTAKAKGMLLDARNQSKDPDAVDGPDGCAALDAEDMMVRAQDASNFLKALAHEGRLMILCHLSSGEKSVTELENLLSSRQAAVSQQLARLRLEGLVSCRRDGKAIYYSLSDPKAARVIELVYDIFCNPQQ
jgi:ArsR family transcriptional regulator